MTPSEDYQQRVNRTIDHVVTRLRLERALRLLAHNRRASLTHIALSCGFGSSSNFSGVFKQHYGVPPGRVRPPVVAGPPAVPSPTDSNISSCAPEVPVI